MYRIAPTVDVTSRSGLSRQDDIKLTHLRLGHCGFASGLLLIGKHKDGCCEYCGVSETVGHVLLQCPSYSEQRRTMFRGFSDLKINNFSLKNILGHGMFPKERAKLVVKFLREAGIYYKI